MSSAFTHITEDCLTTYIKPCLDGGLEVNDAVQEIARLVGQYRDRSEQEMKALWSLAINMCQEWHVESTEHSSLAQIFAGLAESKNPNCAWGEFDKYCPDPETALAPFLQPSTNGAERQLRVLRLCAFFARLIINGVCEEKMQPISLPCASLLYHADKIEPVRNPERFYLAMVWIHVCANRFYGAASPLSITKTTKTKTSDLVTTTTTEIHDPNQNSSRSDPLAYPQVEAHVSLPYPLSAVKKIFRTRMDGMDEWNMWKEYLTSIEKNENVEEGLKTQATNSLMYMELVPENWKDIKKGDHGAVKSLTGFGV